MSSNFEPALKRQATPLTAYEFDARFAAIFSQTSVGIAESDLSGRFLLVNSRFCEIVGRSQDELVALRMHDITHPDDRTREVELFRRMQETGESFAIEKRIQRPDGSCVWVSNDVALVRAVHGVPQYVLAVTHDITERYVEDQARDALIGAAKATGTRFFETLVAAMAKIFGTRYALLAERHPDEPDRARTLAVWMDGKLGENFEYELTNCPCDQVVSTGLNFVGEKARECFPRNALLQRMNCESYFGKALPSENGEAIGLLAVVDDKRLRLHRRAEATLAFFAGRAGAELERQRSLKMLEERELLLRVVTDHAPMLIAYVDRGHRYRFSNDTHHKWFDVDPISGMHVRKVMGEEAYQQLLPHLESALAGSEVTFEDFVRYPSRGRYVQSTYVPHRDAKGRVPGLIAIVQDVTERHRAERVTEFLAEANSLLSGSLNHEHTLAQITHLIVPSLADWCAIDELKPEGRLELLAAMHWHPEKNQLIRQMRRKYPLAPDSPVGVPLAARTGKPVVYESITDAVLREAAEDEDHFAMLKQLNIKSAIMVPLKCRGRVLAVMTLVSCESHYHFTSADLQMLEELARRCALVMENSRLYSEAQREVAERARAEAALKEEVKRKDDFLAILGHELRNPLASIQNCLDILERSSESREQRDRTHDTMARQVRHMSRLIDDLLDVSRISQGKIPLDRRDFDLSQTVGETVRDQETSFTGKGLEVELDLPNQPIWVNGDAVRIAQALINLLRNAESFTDAGGKVTVSARQAAGFATVSVADTGIGMEEQTLARLFRPFAQADNSLDRSRGGLGLGLAVAKGIIELHGGRVEASSEGINKGSRFTLHLPLLGGTHRAQPEPRAAETPHRRLRVLVIEDNRDIADTTQVLLEILGQQASLCYDGEQGIRAARETSPDVVLCDLGLPGNISGFDVAKALRNDCSQPYLVAVTGYGGEIEKARALAAGFHRHLCKPIGADALEELFASIPQ